jgi:hypothetical protein
VVWVSCLAAALAAQPGPVQAGTPSQSKLSIHQLTSYTPGARDIVAAHPRILKVMGIATGPPLDMVRDYKASTPDGLVVLREYTGHRYSVSEDPAEAARHFWDTVLAPPISLLSPTDRALIDYLEGPNEGDSTPTWGSAQDAIWFNDFWITLAPLIGDAGFKPCAFSISVGNPPGSLQDVYGALDRIVPALRLVKSLGGAWSYHSYTIPYTTEVGQEIWYSLRYRLYYDYFARWYPDIVDLPLILTEGGVDGHPGPGGAGWQNAGDAEMYQSWLTWYDRQIRQDSYVLGVTLFQSGSPGWASYEIEPIASWLADYLTSQTTTPVISLSPTGITAAVTEGENPTADSFSVLNVSGGTLVYSIASDVDWLVVSPSDGVSAGQTNTHMIEYTVSSFTQGTYAALITVADSQAGNSPQTLVLELTVGPPQYPGDFDNDSDVDQSDYGHFQTCLSGPGVVQPILDCQQADLDDDGDVDINDFGIFQTCMSGANVPADPGCAR